VMEIDPGINDVLIKCGKPGGEEIEGRARRAQRCQTTRRSCTRSLSRFASRCTKWHPRRGNRALAPRAPPTDRNVQVIVEIEAGAATVERLFMISERHGWTFGQALEYALDAFELALAKTATRV
jgi:hypothetical protein